MQSDRVLIEMVLSLCRLNRLSLTRSVCECERTNEQTLGANLALTEEWRCTSRCCGRASCIFASLDVRRLREKSDDCQREYPERWITRLVGR